MGGVEMASIIQVREKLKRESANEMVLRNITPGEAGEMFQRFLEVDGYIRTGSYGLGWANLGRIAFIIDQAKLRLAISPECLIDPGTWDPDELEGKA
jgi:hypothetical protein